MSDCIVVAVAVAVCFFMEIVLQDVKCLKKIDSFLLSFFLQTESGVLALYVIFPLFGLVNMDQVDLKFVLSKQHLIA